MFCNMAVSDGFRDVQADIRNRIGQFCTFGSTYYSEYKPHSLLDINNDGEKFDRCAVLHGRLDAAGRDVAGPSAVTCNGRTRARHQVPFQENKRVQTRWCCDSTAYGARRKRHTFRP